MKTTKIALIAVLAFSGVAAFTQSGLMPHEIPSSQKNLHASAELAPAEIVTEAPVPVEEIAVEPESIEEAPVEVPPVEEPVAPAPPVEAPAPVVEAPAPVVVAPAPVPAPAAVQQQAPQGSLLPGENGYQWIQRMQEEYGVYAYPGTQFFVEANTPCTFRSNIDGCTEQWVLLDGTITHTNIKVHIPERAIGNLYILFHEIAHSQGILDECQADIYSRNVTGIPGGYYCS